MKNFGAILFLFAAAGSFVTGTPAFSHERRSISAGSANLAARALELVPRVRMGSRASNETENEARSLIARNHNSTGDADAENIARSLFARNHMNCTDDAGADAGGAEKRSFVPHLRRSHQLNETDA
ncbi:hypothetical protein M426DRAFT_321949 [Hypoxylon sp. CI-4A]|nr:hypothetical protein M426DRAFT_321949 [Hypoxylon sp. CI-4A]